MAAVLNPPTSLQVINSTISGNSAPTGAGITNAGTTIIINSTITGNTSTGAGGGIYSPNIGVNAIDSTISGNSATSGGGILGPTSGSSLRGSIVAKNTGGDLLGAFFGNNNLIGDSLSALTGSNNFVGDPYLSTLGFYGGPTKTMVPRPVSGSQVFGNGYSNVSYTTDQRGFLRPTTSPDIGAFQTQSDPLLVNTTQDGPVGPGFLTLRNAINLAGAFNVNQIDYVDFASTLTTGGAATINLSGTPLFANVTTGLLLILGPASGFAHRQRHRITVQY